MNLSFAIFLSSINSSSSDLAKPFILASVAGIIPEGNGKISFIITSAKSGFPGSSETTVISSLKSRFSGTHIKEAFNLAYPVFLSLRIFFPVSRSNASPEANSTLEKFVISTVCKKLLKLNSTL